MWQSKLRRKAYSSLRLQTTNVIDEEGMENPILFLINQNEEMGISKRSARPSFSSKWK